MPTKDPDTSSNGPLTPKPPVLAAAVDDRFLVRTPGVFDVFMEAQGFEPVFTFDDGTRVFERGHTGPAEEREFIAFREVDGALVWNEGPDLDVVYDNWDENDLGESLRETTIDFAEESQSLLAFLQREGIEGVDEATRELAAWKTYLDHSGVIPPPLGVRARLDGEAVSPTAQTAHALAFAERLRAQGFEWIGALGTNGQWPIFARPGAGQQCDRVIWRIGPDGEPRFKDAEFIPLLPAERLARARGGGEERDLPFEYADVTGHELDFSDFLRAEGLPASRLPAGFSLGLPFDPAHAHGTERADLRGGELLQQREVTGISGVDRFRGSPSAGWNQAALAKPGAGKSTTSFEALFGLPPAGRAKQERTR
jgi:hypothetical protein